VNRARLQAVLRVRSLQERAARGELARRSQEHRRAAEAEEHTWQLLQQLAPSPDSPVSDLQALQAVRSAGTLAAVRQHGETDEAREHTVMARDEWTVAARRVEALDRLGERLLEAEEAEEERKQILEVDDLVLARRGRTASGIAETAP
jgi:flagellar export protein FliJ